MSNSIITTTKILTPEQQQAKALAQQQAIVFGQMQSAFVQAARFIWADPSKAQARFDAFAAAGYRPVDLLTNAAAYAAMLKVLTGQDAPSPVPTGWTLTANADGTVTVTPPQT